MSGYEPFASFDHWAHLRVDPGRWSVVVDHVAELRSDPTDLSWLDGSLRAAAYQSGAIEGLHPGDRGLTMTLIDNVPGWNWEEALRNSLEAGEVDVLAYVEAGVEALQMALDVATNNRPLSESWIRQVHELACAPQQTYRVHTPAGPQDHPLIKGSYKQHDNHVLQPDGSTHWYAPASEVAHEMEQLVGQLSSDEFAAAHPVLQAAFAHHSFTHIHPFADGNGRVARVLTSVFLLRSVSLPLFLFADRRDRYFAALSAADRGQFATFTGEVRRAVEDLAALLVERLRARQVFAGDDLKTRIDRARAFQRAVDDAAARAMLRHGLEVEGSASRPTTAQPLPQATTEITLSVRSGSNSTYTEILDVSTPITRDDDFSVRSRLGSRHLSVRPEVVWPSLTDAFGLRLDAWFDQVIGDLAKAIWP